jgi:SAM-dependent methyltransferase
MKDEIEENEDEMDMVDKVILDACCGGRHIWIQKNNDKTVYMDIRAVERGTIQLQPNWCVEPDIVSDYRDMPFDDNTFRLVVWDVPHKIKPDRGIITTKYGNLGNRWKEDLAEGFDEIMRVLKPEGILCFKFNDLDISFKEVLDIFPVKPLFGTPTKKGVNNTAWFIYMKDCKEESE